MQLPNIITTDYINIYNMGMGTDAKIIMDVLKYKMKFDYPVFVETGTYAGSSSWIASGHFDKVYTCDINNDMEKERNEKFAESENIEFLLADSREALPVFFNKIGNDKFFLFLDAHWNGQFPVLDELQIVADFGYKPFIFIHDFDCGHEGWNYDFDSNGNKLSYDYVKEKMDLIYGVDGYNFEVSQESLNSPNQSGLPNKIGCGFFFPKD